MSEEKQTTYTVTVYAENGTRLEQWDNVTEGKYTDLVRKFLLADGRTVDVIGGIVTIEKNPRLPESVI